MDISKDYLSKEEMAVGLVLEEDTDFYRLKHGAVELAHWWKRSASLVDIRHEIDQQYNWLKSGIKFVRGE